MVEALLCMLSGVFAGMWEAATAFITGVLLPLGISVLKDGFDLLLIHLGNSAPRYVAVAG